MVINLISDLRKLSTSTTIHLVGIGFFVVRGAARKAHMHHFRSNEASFTSTIPSSCTRASPHHSVG